MHNNIRNSTNSGSTSTRSIIGFYREEVDNLLCDTVGMAVGSLSALISSSVGDSEAIPYIGIIKKKLSGVG